MAGPGLRSTLNRDYFGFKIKITIRYETNAHTGLILLDIATGRARSVDPKKYWYDLHIRRGSSVRV